MNNLIILNAVTNTISGTVDGGYPRSIYNSDERFNQTLESIKSAKTNIPNCKIILVEASPLTEEQQKIYSSLCYVVNISDIPTVKQIVNGNNKSLGEAITMFYAMEFIMKNQIEYSILFKLCSRNVFNEHFNINNFSSDKFSFRKFQNSYGRCHYSSGFYTIPWSLRFVYLTALVNSMLSMATKEILDMEGNLYVHIPQDKVNCLQLLGISGTAGATKEPFEH
jgi:hypothetical protein